MLIQLVEHRAREALLALIEDINRVQTAVWGMAFLKRRALKPISNDEFLLVLKPAFADVSEAKAFVLENGDIYLAWRGMQKRVHDGLLALVGKALLKASDSGAGSSIVYFDPLVMGNELTTLLRAQAREQGAASEAAAHSSKLAASKNLPKPNATQLHKFQEHRQHRGERRQLEILVVEDQQLLRRLLHEVLRGEHLVDSVAGLQEGCEHYLEKAPDVAFLDIGLADGNGHDLARAIKQLDPDSCVVMVTANNTEEDMEFARGNHADGFVAKPYSKQQIFDYIDRHVSARRLATMRDKFA